LESLRRKLENWDPEYWVNPAPPFIYDFLFEHHEDCMDELDPMDIMDCLITDRIPQHISNLPTDIITFDYRGGGFTRYRTPMVIVDGIKGKCLWNNMVPVSISTTPKILISDELLQKRSDLTKIEWDDILQFIVDNNDILLDQWYCQIEEKYGVDWHDVNKLWRIKPKKGES
jgi:hypothetical protein